MMGSLGFVLHAIIWSVFILSCDSSITDEVSALLAFKESIYEDPRSILSNWNSLDKDPCDWSGIFCTSTGDHVITLNLSSSWLKGFLAPELSTLTSLQTLILHKNSLLGTIPKQLGLLKSLKVLDLSSNQLSGPIPREIGNLTNIVKMYLQSNQLTGTIPPEIGNLINLVELRLDRNKLQGTVPGSDGSINFTSTLQGMYVPSRNTSGFCHSPLLKVADFSYNFFIGRIPSCLKNLPRSSFQQNCFQDRDSNFQRSSQQCDASPPSAKNHSTSLPAFKHEGGGDTKKSSSRPTWLLVLEIITGLIGGSLLVFAILAAVIKYRPKCSNAMPWKKVPDTVDHQAIPIDSDMVKDVLKISRQELEVACEDFSNIIGSSPDSVVYKGTMKGGPEIAVISLCISEENWRSYLELYFQSQVADFARLNSENTSKLLGYCKENDPFSRMLVFEYASNGTLYEHLHYGEGCQLSWTKRMKIVIGIARGLKYLHSEIEPPFTISELSSSAVYLTEDFSPKLVDFECWKTILVKSGKNSGSIGNGGALPVEGHHDDIQGNTFAFGVLLLEIISGRPPYCKDRGCLVDWAREYLEMPEVISYLVDPELRYFRYEDLRLICEVVNLCVQTDPFKRPSMKLLSNMLENEIDISPAADLKESPLVWAELAIAAELQSSTM